MNYHIAQANIAKMIARFDDPRMSGLVQRVDEMNALAGKSRGFVWRFKPENGDPAHLAPFVDYFASCDPGQIFFNMSVWETIDHLKAYIFESAHLELWKNRSQWLLKPERPHLAMWWIPVGNFPSVEEGRRRLTLIEQNGATSEAFHFAQTFPAPIHGEPL